MKPCLFFGIWLLTMLLPAPIRAQQPMPMLFESSLTYLRLQVNDSGPLLFLIDTGANASAIDEQIADSLRLPLARPDSVQGTAGTVAVQMVRLGKVRIGRQQVKNLTASRYSLAGLLRPAGQRVAGILGTDFLRHFAVTFDFGQRQLTLARRYSGADTFVPFEMDNGIPRIAAVFNDTVRTFLRYDSGASMGDTEKVYLNVTSAVWQQLQAAAPTLTPERYFTATGVGGTVRLPVVRLASARLHTLRISGPCIIVQPAQGYFAQPDAVGFFGNNLLSKYQRVTLDFRANRLYLAARQ